MSLFLLLLSVPSCSKFEASPDEDKETTVEPDDEDDDNEDVDAGEKPGGGKGDNGNGSDNIEEGDTINVTKFLNNQIIYGVHVRGYIVGAATGKNGSRQYDFTPPFTFDTAIMLADSKTETSKQKVMTVCITKGPKSPRESLNLKDNPENLGREIIVYGSQDKYLGILGIKELGAWNFVSKK